MSQVSTSGFQKGMFILFRGEIHQIVTFQHVNPGKGSAFVRTKLRNLKTANSIEFTYKSGEQVDQITVFVKELQYLYKDGSNFVFMDNSSYEQMSLNESLVGDFGKYLKEGEIYQVYMHEDEGLGIRAPKKVKLKVTEANEAVKGNTVSGAKKIVLLETGLKIAVPLFIKTGDMVSVDPESGEYVERVNG